MKGERCDGFHEIAVQFVGFSVAGEKDWETPSWSSLVYATVLLEF